MSKITSSQLQVPWKRVTNVTPLTAGNTSSTTFVNIPSNTVQLASLVKVRGDTNIVVHLDVSFFLITSAGQVTFGVNFNSTDYTITSRFMNELSSYKSISGTIEVPSIAAGTYTFTARVKTTAGNVNFDSAGSISMYVEEVKAA